jgi:hypothetical protein
MARELSLGKIVELSTVDQGYRRLAVAVNLPFRTKVLKFNVWNDNLLQKETLEPYKEGDDVAVDYHYQGSYLRLNGLKPILLDSCPICYTYREATDAQRIDCLECDSIPEDSKKTRVNCRMRLTSKSKKQYMYSLGFRLQLVPEGEEGKTYTAVIFENNLLFPKVPMFKTGENYFVVGWISNNLLDIIDIY